MWQAQGNELSKIKNILTYIHNTIKHDGNHESPAGSNIIKWAEACKGGARGLHCGGLAHVLKDCYLSMGFKARHISGLPQKYIGECHSIDVVYSNTLDKWIWVDPTNNAWVMDENGIMLSVQEVRERLRDGRPVILNEEANWNNQQKITKEYYLDSYMAKNLYSIKADDVLLCPQTLMQKTSSKPSTWSMTMPGSGSRPIRNKKTDDASGRDTSSI